MRLRNISGGRLNQQAILESYQIGCWTANKGMFKTNISLETQRTARLYCQSPFFNDIFRHKKKKRSLNSIIEVIEGVSPSKQMVVHMKMTNLNENTLSVKLSRFFLQHNDNRADNIENCFGRSRSGKMI